MKPKYSTNQTVTFTKKGINYVSKIENAYEGGKGWIYKLKHHNEKIAEDSIIELIEDSTEQKILELDTKLTEMATNAKQVADVTIVTLTQILKDIQSTLKKLANDNRGTKKTPSKEGNTNGSL